jgi:hypothetical protein
MEDSLPTTIPQYQKSSLPSIPYYSKLEAKFWDSENIIMRRYKKIKDRTKDNTSLAHVEKSKDILTSPEMKSEYNSNLFYHYISSQPSTIIQLIELTSNVVYPFYLFILDSCNYSYLILDYLTFQLKFLDAKLEVAQSIEVMTITDINVNDGVITLKTSSVKKVKILSADTLGSESLCLSYKGLAFDSHTWNASISPFWPLRSIAYCAT